MNNRKRTSHLAFAVTAVLTGAWIVHTFYPFDGTYRIKTFQLTNGRSIELRADTFWEISQGVHYRVRGSSRSGMVGFTTERAGSLDFLVISAEHGNLVGIVEAANPDVVLVLHDFSHDDSWPFQHGTEQWTETQARGESMLKRLSFEHSEIYLVLSHSVPGSRSLRIN